MANGQGVTDLVPHLRTVHFALLLACILTLLPTMLGRRGEVSEAHRQLQKIQAMRNSWDRWTQKFSLEQIKWLDTLGVRWLGPASEHAYIDSPTLTQAGIQPSPGYVLGVRLEGVPVYFHLAVKDMKGEPSDLILAVPYGRLDKSDVLPLAISFPAQDSGSKPFASLTDFRQFWAGAQLPKVTFLHRFSPIAYLVVDGAIRNELPLKEKRENKGPYGRQRFLSKRLGGCPGIDIALIHNRVGDTGFNELFCTTDLGPGSIAIPADVRTVRVPEDLRQWLIKEFNLGGAGGDFSTMFPELNKVANVLETLDIDKIGQILKAELDRQGDRVQFLGISLPEPAMASWGMIIVLATHTYFWLHLRAFKKAESASSSVPFILPRRDTPRHAWIGLYEDCWASVVTILTVSIVPPGVVIWAGFFVSSWPWWSSVLITLTVLAMAADSARLLVDTRFTAIMGKFKTIVVHYWPEREARVTPPPSQDVERP
jgi:hypothetical protein